MEQFNLQAAKILVVDDNPINIEVVFGSLGEEFDVYMANAGEKALRLCDKKHFDLILLDIDLPGISGLDVCKKLNLDENTRDIPVIFITAYEDEESEIACWEAGCVDFIKKPINQITLKKRVDAHLRLKLQSDLLRRSANTDGLTGISNRRHFDTEFDREWRRCRRANISCTVAMIDIDHFKRYNDHYGHLKGDDCLKLVAKTLSEQLNRPGDLIARFGGEEFVVVLPNSSVEKNLKMIEQLLESVRKLKIEHLTSTVVPYVTLSIGAYTCFPSKSEQADSALDKADKMLYKAKQNGRNRLEF